MLVRVCVSLAAALIAPVTLFADTQPNLPPDCSAAFASIDQLWPPNHKMTSVSIDGVTDPESDPVTVSVVCINQDEPLNANGDGSTEIDAQGVGQSAAILRAERQGGGDGRVYHIGFSATDISGAQCRGEVRVDVRHNRKTPAVDSATLFSSTGAPTTDCGTSQNLPPIFSSEPVLQGKEGENYQYQPSVSDADGDVITLRLLQAPEGMTLNNGVVAWLPTFEQSGEHTVILEGSDAVHKVEQTFTIVVEDTNRAPEITSVPLTIAQEGSSYSYHILATDDDGDDLGYALLTGPQGIDISNEGLLSWDLDFNSAGTYQISASVTDGKETVTQEFSLVVANTNRAPVFDSNPLLTVSEGGLYSYHLQASDADSDLLSITLISGPLGMSLDQELLSWSPEYDQAGTYQVVLSATDGDATTQQIFLVTVTDVNRAPYFTSQPLTSAVEGESYQYKLVVEDDDGDALQLSLTSAPLGLVLNSTSGTLEWTEPVAGDFAVVVSADDGRGAIVEQSFTLNVVQLPPSVSAEGTEFWLMFNTIFAPLASKTLEVSGVPGTEFSVEIPLADVNINDIIPSGGVQSVQLFDLRNVIQSEDFGVNGSGIRVRSEEKIQVRLLHRVEEATDGALLFPIDALGNNYVAVGYNKKEWLSNTEFTYGNFIGVVATEDFTTVTITPTATLKEKPTSEQRIKGVPYQVILNAGETYQALRVDFDEDVSGTQIQSDKPVAAFSGDQCAAVGAYFCDHLVEQLIPVRSQGNHFLTMPLATRKNGDIFRIVAAENNTHVWIGGDLGAFLDAGDFHQLELDSPTEISSDKPVTVMQFAQGYNHDANQTGLPFGYSDPFMMTVPSIEQFNRQVNFITPETYPDFNYLNMIAPIHALEGVTLDGVVVAPSFWQAIPETDFAGAQIPVAAGKHNVMSDVPIGSTLYGWEYFESYGALGALTLNDGRVASQLVINGVSEAPLGEQACWQIRALDEESVPVNQAQLFITRVASDVQRTFMRMTDERGSAQFCYTGLRAGEEILVFRMGNASAQTEQQRDVRWLQVGSEQNRTPQIVNLPPMYATPGRPYTHQTIVHDADLDRINFLLTENPPGMTIDDSTGVIEWQTPRDFDSTWITIIADDGRGGIDKQRYWLRFARGSNRYPAFTSEPVTRAVAGRLYSYQMSGFDRDRDSFVFQLIDGPEGMQVNGQNLEWTPTLANLGHHLVEVRIQDENGDGENRLFTLNVEANLDPAFISAPPVTGVIGHEYLYFFDAVDGNADALTYSLPQAPTGMQLVAVGTTRYLRWTPQTGQGGEVPLVLRADDNFGGVTDQVFIISVEENAVPEFTSTPPPSAVSGHTYFYTPQTFDSNGDTVVLTLTSAPTGASIVGGVMRWTPTLEQVGTHAITIRAEDNRGGWATQTFTLTVAINSPPVVTSVPPVSATVGHRLVYLPKATDAEGDFSTFSLLSGPVGMSMFANQLSWVPESGQVGQQTVTVAANDGKGGTSTQVFTLQVAENASPLFTTAPFGGAKVGTRYGYTMRAVDADGDGVLYRLVEGPAGASVFLTGQLWWIPQATQTGDHPFIVEAYDNYSGVTRQAFTLRVISDALQIVGIPDGALLYNDEMFASQIQALHPNNLSVTYSLDQSPAGVTLDAISGQLVWTPTEDQIGMHQISVSADSADGQHDSATFTLEVEQNTNQAPVFTSTAITSVRAGDDYFYQVMAQDPQGHAINYSLTQSPVLMTIDAHSGLLSWSPLEVNVGAYEITVRATDERGKFAEQTFTLNVSFANRKPQVSGATANQAVVDYLYQSLLPVTDPDGDALTFSAYSVPVGVSVDALTGLVSWTPTTDQVGQQVLEILVSDGEHSIVVGWHVTVLAEPLPLEITAQVTPQFVQPDESVALQLQINGAVTTPEVAVTLDGETVALDDAFSASLSSSIPGRHEIAVSVNDGVRVATTHTYFSVADVDDQTAPEVVIHTPLGGSRITAPTDIRVTVRDANIADVILALRRPGAAEHSYKELYRGTTTFDDEVIATFDPTMLRNGMYNLILQATDINGQQTNSAIPVIVEGGLKVGLFSMTIEDLSLPMAGIPVRVTRTYDSRERQESGDFGFGWRVDYQNARVDESSEPTESWYQETRNLQFKFEDTQVIAPGTCTYARASKLVTVTLPNDDVEKFRVHAKPVNGSPASVSDPDCHFLADRYFDLQFEPIGDTDSTLEAESSESLFLTDTTDGNLSYIGETAPVQIVRYRLTTRQGYVYHLNQAFGIEKIVDPNGTTLTYSENGIEHSDGLSIVFTRDANGRIETIEDPAGNIYQYLYSDDGDLLTMEDPLLHRSEYRYNTNHGLVDIVDGLGRRLLRNLYDQDGRLTAQEDSDGNRLEFNHDLAGRQSVVTNRRGYSTVFNYDDRGNVLSRVNAHGKASHFTYDENDNQLSETDALGYQRKATFNERSDQLSATDALGHSTYYTYNAKGQELTISDALGYTFNNRYSDVGNLLSIADPEGNGAVNTYDNWGRITASQDLLGNVSQYTYGAYNKKATETDPLGHTTRWTYNDNANIATETTSRQVQGVSVEDTTSYTYDALDRVVATTDALGRTTRSEFDAAGNEVATIDARGRRTEMTYDGYGRVLTTTYADGSTESNDYDSEGNLTRSTDRLGRITEYEYDALDRLILTRFPDASTHRTEYDDAGRVSAEIDARNARSEYEYDAAGRRTAVIDALGNRHLFAYDANGNLVSETDAKGHTTQYDYNRLNQRILTRFHNGSAVTDQFDALSRKVASTDQANRTTHYEYDALGRLSKVIDATNGETAYSYDSRGNKLTQTDAEGRITRWEYDALGRVTARILPMGQRETFAYDAVGNVLVHVDFNGQVTTSEYDSLNRLTKKTYADGIVETWTYDAAGRTTQTSQTIDGNTEVTAYAYDDRDRLIEETKPDGSVLTYTYDLNGNKTAVTVTPAGGGPRTVSYTYDALNRLSTVTDEHGVTTYTYDPVGNRVAVTQANGVATSYRYDALNRLSQLTSRASDGTILQQYDYTLDATGRRTLIEEYNGRVSAYVYDDLYRLVEEAISDPVNGNHQSLYQYDGVGNRIQATVNGVVTTYDYDANDRLLSQGGTSYSYDDNGNTMAEINASGSTSYVWDARNRLVETTTPAGTLLYGYDIDGIRTSRSEGGIITNFVVDHNQQYAQVLAETEGGATTKQYTYGDDLLSQTAGGQERFFLYDGLGTTRALADGAEVVTDTYAYEAFGQLLASTGSSDNSYRYTGEQYDSGLDQYYLRARYYDQGVGRFTQMDTWMGRSQDPVTLHKYLYANADPVRYVDPSGQMSIGSLMSAVGNAARLATNATVNLTRSFASRVNGRVIRGVGSIRARIWLTRSVNRVKSRLPQELQQQLGKGAPSRNGVGWRWRSKGAEIRVQRGNPASSNPAQRVDYVKITADGKVIGRNGKPITSGKPGQSPESHIPLSEWLNWGSWKSLL